MSNFWTVQFFKNRIQGEFWFSAHPYFVAVDAAVFTSVLLCL